MIGACSALDFSLTNEQRTIRRMSPDGSLQWVAQDVVPHLPSWRVLLMLAPLLLQASLLMINQTTTTRFCRAALVPIGLWYAYASLFYDFTPRGAFKACNFIRSLMFPVGVEKTLEYGLVQDQYRWIGFEKERAAHPADDSGGTHTSNGKARPREVRNGSHLAPREESKQHVMASALRDGVSLIAR